MSDRASPFHDIPVPATSEDRSHATEAAAAHRFGEAVHLLDRLDTRPLEQRMPTRPWWRLW